VEYKATCADGKGLVGQVEAAFYEQNATNSQNADVYLRTNCPS
jgi:hypothetical protein